MTRKAAGIGLALCVHDDRCARTDDLRHIVQSRKEHRAALQPLLAGRCQEIVDGADTLPAFWQNRKRQLFNLRLAKVMDQHP